MSDTKNDTQLECIVIANGHCDTGMFLQNLNSRRILAIIQQSLIFIALFYLYTNRPINDENYEHEFHKINSPITYDRSTSLTIVHEFQFKIQPEYLKGVVIENRYLVQDTLGDGFTGFVRSGIDLNTGTPIAIKFASENRFYSLDLEYINYLYLGAEDPDVVQFGIPSILYYGEFLGYRVLVMTKAGRTLSDLMENTEGERFSLSTICKIAIKVIRIIEYIHSKGLIFHDVKPTNIAISETNANEIVLFDFAFSEFWANAMGEPKPREIADEINGTPEYMARGPLNRYTQMRKDDFISLGLVLLELNGVDLPWMKSTKSEDDIYQTMDIVLDEWEKYGIESICDLSDNPQLFMQFFNYFDSLQSNERPDYDYLVELFTNALTPEELADESLGIVLKNHTNSIMKEENI